LILATLPEVPIQKIRGKTRVRSRPVRDRN
jgi:hypothetical protein